MLLIRQMFLKKPDKCYAFNPTNVKFNNMDRIVHNSITIESGNVNMRERVHKTINKNIICKTYLAHIHSL